MIKHLRRSRIVRTIASLRLTVGCLVLAGVLILAGTLAQVDRGIWQVQDIYFQSLVIWVPVGESLSLPLLPGGHLIGIVLVINLIAAHLVHFRLSWRKSGIQLIHAGLILVLVGQFVTDLFSTESSLILDEGASRDFTESHFEVELALIDTSHPDRDVVYAIPWSRLVSGQDIDESLPVRIRTVETLANSRIVNTSGHQLMPPDAEADQGLGVGLAVTEVSRATKTDERDVPAAYLEIGEDGAAGTWLVSTAINQPQSFDWQGKTYTLALRHQRHYMPYDIRLTDFTHEKHEGTEIPSSFVSRVEIVDASGKPRSQSIYMNHPMRLDGKTFYQASFANNDTTSILQVVDNPAWGMPYIASGMIGLGMAVQFGIGLTRSRRPKQEATE
ncbi:MAG: cytochrome c biogenesis protein ResB [Planctomycetota bacterium]